MTSPFNPYEPPAADALEPGITRADDSPQHLASLGQRWLAAMIDGLLAAIVVAPIQYKLGVFAKYAAKVEPNFWENAGWAAIYFAAWLVENGYFLATSSQTIGKRMVGIRIENVAGGRTAFWKLVLVRNLPFSCIGQIPVIGVVLVLADPLLIFRKDRRCLHDHLAGTQVVRVR